MSLLGFMSLIFICMMIGFGLSLTAIILVILIMLSKEVFLRFKNSKYYDPYLNKRNYIINIVKNFILLYYNKYLSKYIEKIKVKYNKKKKGLVFFVLNILIALKDILQKLILKIQKSNIE